MRCGRTRERRGGTQSRTAVVAATAFAAAAFPAAASIDLTLSTSQSQYTVGSQVSVGVFGRGNLGEAEGMFSFQMIVTWDTSRLHLDGVSTAGGQPFTAVGFFHDAYGLNEATPPTDGNGILIGLGPLGSSIVAPPQGVLLTTLLFTALGPAPATPLNILPSAGNPVGTTVVYGDTGPNVNDTGALNSTSVRIVPAPAAAPALLLGAAWTTRRRRSRTGGAPFRDGAPENSCGRLRAAAHQG
jgi:uncharacterized protein (TIGR03382 family)